jgi:hypothetical protein
VLLYAIPCRSIGQILQRKSIRRVSGGEWMVVVGARRNNHLALYIEWSNWMSVGLNVLLFPLRMVFISS